MGDLCRLCCTTKFVNHPIFDDKNALYKKISQYLPIKAFKDDKLPQKICDSCCIKVHDFHQFYTRTLEVQRRLQLLIYTTVLPFEDPVTRFDNKQHRATQTDIVDDDINPGNCNNHIKSEPPSRSPSPVKVEVEIYNNDPPYTDAEDVPLINLKKDKKANRKDRGENGEVREKKRRKKKKKKVESNGLNVEGEEREVAVKDEGVDLGEVAVKQEPDLQFCCMCLLQCDSKEEMKEHYKKEHGGLGRDKPTPPPPMPAARPLRCMRCKKAVEEAEWARHWRRHWERDRRPYRCVLCEMIFRDHKLIYKHGLTHKMGEARAPPLKRFVCDLCPEAFVHMRWLVSHRHSAHPEERARALALRCAVCARQFAHLNSLRRHLRAHSGRRDFLCSVCGKALSSREHLKFHLRIHTGYKPHVCKTCGKGFVKKCNLTLHERVHSGEKPHVCAHCGKAFSQRSTLVIHERYHSGARPYVCSLCGRGFVAKGLLSMHQKTTCVEAS